MEIVALCVSIAALAVSLVSLVILARLHRRIKHAELQSFTGSEARGGAGETPQTDTDNSSAAEERYSPYGSDDETFISHLEELIEANLGNHNLNVDFLAAGMMVSRSLLFNRVRRATGKGIIEFVNGIRIERSIEMMPEADRSLTEIAELSGFSTLRYYSRVFKAVKGEIPSVYREQMLDRQAAEQQKST